MCEPTIIAVATAASTVMQGYAAKQQGEYERDVSRYNARQQENEATQIRNKAVEEEMRQREKTAQIAASQRAQFAANNVQVNTGSALDIQEDTIALGEVDAMRIRSNYDYQATALEDQAVLTRSAGDAAAKSGRNAFFGSLLTAGGQAAGSGVSSKWFTSNSAAPVSTSTAAFTR